MGPARRELRKGAQGVMKLEQIHPRRATPPTRALQVSMLCPDSARGEAQKLLSSRDRNFTSEVSGEAHVPIRKLNYLIQGSEILGDVGVAVPRQSDLWR